MVVAARVAADGMSVVQVEVCLTDADGNRTSLDEAIRGMTQIREAVMPNRDLAEIYDRKYRLYLKTVQCLDGLWDEMQQMVEQSNG